MATCQHCHKEHLRIDMAIDDDIDNQHICLDCWDDIAIESYPDLPYARFGGDE